MPAVVQQSKLLAKLGAKLTKAHAEHKDDDIKLPRGGELPPIENGIAQLYDMHFGVYKDGPNKGQPFFMAQATVVFPKTVDIDGVAFPVEGGQTRVGPEPICDTKTMAGKETTFSEHWANVLNWCKMLGFDASSVDGTPEQVEAGILAGMAELVKQKVTFQFRTWKGRASKEYPDPRVNHVWGMACEFDQEEGDGDVVDDSQKVEEPAPASAPVKGPPKGPTKAAPAAAPEPESEDLEALAEAAHGEGKPAEDASIRLTELAEAAGVDPNAHDTWQKVVAAIRETEAGGGEEGTADADALKAGESVVKYKPVTVDKTTKKRTQAKKAVECLVTEVDEEKRTVKLKNIDDGKSVYTGVSIDSLEAD